MRSIKRLLLFSVASVFAGSGSGVVVNTCTAPGLVALTFDEGPSVQNTGGLLDLLASRGVKATFHFVTQFANDQSAASLMKRAANEGHLIGLRAETSWNLVNTTADTVASLFSQTRQALESKIGRVVKFARLPYQQYNATVVVPAVEGLGLVVTEHNLDSYDYKGMQPIDSFKNYMEPADPKSSSFISLQKDSTSGVASQTDNVISYVISKGYKIVLLDECLGMAPASTSSSASTKTSSSTKISVSTTSPILSTSTSTAAPGSSSVGGVSTSTASASASPSSDGSDSNNFGGSTGDAAPRLLTPLNAAIGAVTFLIGLVLAWI